MRPSEGCAWLMFASDGTQLTSFSPTKLWPVYLTIGNESKDRRSKPSCQAFEHVAYLQMVSETSYAECYISTSTGADSFLMTSQALQQTILARHPIPHSWSTAIKKCTTLNGQSSWMMNSWKHTGMEWCESVVIAEGAIFIHIYSLIPQITRKSRLSLCYWNTNNSNVS